MCLREKEVVCVYIVNIYISQQGMSKISDYKRKCCDGNCGIDILYDKCN